MVFSPVATQQAGSWYESQLDVAWVLSSCSTQIHVCKALKLTLGVSVNVDGCLSVLLCEGLSMVYLTLSPNDRVG